MRKKLNRTDVRKLAEIFCIGHKRARGHTLDYSPESLASVDSDFDQMRLEGARSDEVPALCFTAGCYLAEVMRRNIRDVRWSSTDNAIILANGIHVNALDKPSKRLDIGPEDSLFDFYQATVDIAIGKLDLAALCDASKPGSRSVLTSHGDGIYSMQAK